MFKLTQHTDGTVSLRLPASSFQGNGPGLDTIVSALEYGALNFEGPNAPDSETREIHARIAARFRELQDAIADTLK